MAELTKMVSSLNLPHDHAERVRATFPDLEFIVCSDKSELSEALPGAQALFGTLADLPADRFVHLPDLRWVQVSSAGVNSLLRPEMVDSDLVITNGSGIHAVNIAEHLLSLMFAFARRLPDLFQAQTERKWARIDRGAVFELNSQTLAIIGLGDIGSQLARGAAGLGMHVVGSKRRGGEAPPGVSQLYGPDQLHEMLAEADHVAICLPLTPRTRQLIGAAELAAMKPTAYLYNIGRGEIIDQDALIAALQSGEIAGAGLDVTVPEPLPADSPLWDLPNVIITGHNAGRTPNYMTRAVDLLIENIGRYRRDEPLINIVNKREGY